MKKILQVPMDKLPSGEQEGNHLRVREKEAPHTCSGRGRRPAIIWGGLDQ